MKSFEAIIRDSWPKCPGAICLGPFATRKEAEFAAEREVEAAAELFDDGRSNLTVEIREMT